MPLVVLGQPPVTNPRAGTFTLSFASFDHQDAIGAAYAQTWNWDPAVPAFTGTSGAGGGSTKYRVATIPIAVGDKLGNVRVWVNDQPANTMTLKVYKVDMANNTATQLGATATSTLSANNEPLDVDCAQEVGAADFCYYALVTSTIATSGRLCGGSYVVT